MGDVREKVLQEEKNYLVTVRGLESVYKGEFVLAVTTLFRI